MKRWESFPGGFFWDEGVDEWKSELYANLYARVLLHETRAGGQKQVEWGGDDGMMGPVEAELAVALQRLWLLWREEEILRGRTSPEALRAVLVPRQREWERTPNELADGVAPFEAVARERAERARRFPNAKDIMSGHDAGGSSGDDTAGDAISLDDLSDDDLNEAIDMLVGGAARLSGTGTKGGGRRGRSKGGKRRHVGPPVVYQMHISLLGTDPPIWRRIQVRSSVSLAQLHDIVQIVMGWEDEHLYEFEFGHDSYAPHDRAVLADTYDAWTTRLGDIGLVPGSVLRYTYDMGDSWEHELRVESAEPIRSDSPTARCLGGERACPPEDSGGVFGYGELLASLRGESHSRDEYEEFLDDLVDRDGRPFDPERFELGKVNDILLRR